MPYRTPTGVPGRSRKEVIDPPPVNTPMFDGPGAANLGNVTRPWVHFFQRVPVAAGEGGEGTPGPPGPQGPMGPAGPPGPGVVGNDRDKCTFGIGIGAVQTIGVQLTPLYNCVYPETGLMPFFEIVSNCGRPGTGSIYLDILRSRDWGETWTSILTTPIVLTAGPTVPHVIVTDFNPAANEIQFRDLLRIDMLAGSNEDWRDIETVVRWK